MNKWKKIVFLCGCVMLLANGLQAAPETDSVPTQLDGDVITYIAKTGVITAQGGVKLTQGNAVMTGNAGEYNVRTKEALISGNVKAMKDGSTLTANEVRSYDGMQRLVAVGNVILVHENGTASGPQMEYVPERQYANITGGSRLTNRDAVVTSTIAEVFFNEDRATADGNVLIVSETRNLDAVADHAIYYGINGKNGKVDLTGNVRAVQEGHVLTGNHVVLYLDDSALDTEGRSKLVIMPKKETPPAKGVN